VKSAKITKSAIYIPTKNREAFAVKCATSLVRLDLGIPIILVTERQRAKALKMSWTEEMISTCALMTMNAKDKGIGYARDYILKSAYRWGLWSIAMIDDDQEMKGDILGWLRAARRTDVVGIGAWKSYYGLLWSGTNVANNIKEKAPAGLYGCTGAQGHQAVALNTYNAMAVGGYDPALRWGEDGDLARKGIATGYPWWVYTGAIAGDFATQRFLRANKVGGLQTPGALDNVEANHLKCHSRYPQYVSCPPKRYSVKWKKMWADNLSWPMDNWPPGNTRSDRPYDWRRVMEYDE
jgi:hypothetical protein